LAVASGLAKGWNMYSAFQALTFLLLMRSMRASGR
jgi:hypothetical protein